MKLKDISGVLTLVSIRPALDDSLAGGPKPSPCERTLMPNTTKTRVFWMALERRHKVCNSSCLEGAIKDIAGRSAKNGKASLKIVGNRVFLAPAILSSLNRISRVMEISKNRSAQSLPTYKSADATLLH